MSNYKEVEGNLLDMFDEGKFDIIAHGCNCFSIMGAGIAKQIKGRYPVAFWADANSPLTPVYKLGNLSWANTKEGGTIVNLYTQFHPGANFSYSAFRLALRKFEHYYGKSNAKVGLPLIGGGIGGGNPEKIKKIIKKELENMDVTLVLLNKI